MALIKSVRGFTPQIGEDCFLAENATVVGDVIMGVGCSVWFNTVLRGDVNSIRIGKKFTARLVGLCHLFRGFLSEPTHHPFLSHMNIIFVPNGICLNSTIPQRFSGL